MSHISFRRMARRLRTTLIIFAFSVGDKITQRTTYRQRKQMDWPIIGLGIIFGAAILWASVKSFSELVTWLNTPEGKSAYAFWIGSKSIFDLMTGGLTTLITIIAALVALQSYRTNQRAAVANRYQKGVELLGAVADSSKLGGIELLSVVAREARGEYQEPVLRTIRQFLQERCSAAMEVCHATEQPTEIPLPNTDFVILSALSAISLTDFRWRWVGPESDKEGFLISGLFLHNVRLLNYNFSRIRFENSAFGNVVFDSCEFSETVMNVKCVGDLVFERCILENSEIYDTDFNGDILNGTSHRVRIFRSRRKANFRVNGQIAG